MYQISYQQKLPITIQQAWEFFSSPTNLEKITPPNLSLKINQTEPLKRMYPGQLITYTVKPLLNIPLEWVTEITAVQEPTYFIDEQKFGPYTFWHHEHWFTPIPNGVLIEDHITYKVPFGPLGKLLHQLKIQPDLAQIFSYRSTALERLFGTYVD